MSKYENSNEIVFERSLIPLSNIMTPDEDGYYWVNAGAYGTYNESGVFYSSDGIEELFNNTSLLQRRLDKGVVRSELGHPRREAHMTDAMFEARNMIIQEDRFCGHIRAAKLVDNVDKKIKITKINITPFGHYKSTLDDALKTKDANCFFSVRSCSNRVLINGVLVKYVYQVVTWDFVNEGGLRVANKFDTNTDLENMSGKSIMDIIKTEELGKINLNDTAEVKYILNNMNEFKNANSHLDSESANMFEQLTSILTKASITNNENSIFNWS